MARMVTYECNECGCVITVSGTPGTELEPIYCCGMEVTEAKPARRKAVKKVKAVKKKTKAAGKKKPAAKKKTSKKSK